MLKRFFVMIIGWFRTPRPQSPAPNRTAVLAAAGLVPEPEPEPAEPEPLPSRAIRRAAESQKRKFERARKKFDQFMVPVGPQPVKKERGEITRAPMSVLSVPDDAPTEECLGDLIVDVHHSDRKTKVLYELDEVAHNEFNFRDTILEQLDRYFFYLSRMKRYDPDSYGFYKALGAVLVPYCSIGDLVFYKNDKLKKEPTKTMSPWFMKTKPAFGCVAFGTNPEIERVEAEFDSEDREKGGKGQFYIPRFLYFVRYEMPPPEVQPKTGGHHYKLTVWFDKPSKTFRYGRPYEVPLFVAPDGKVTVLKLRDTKWLQTHTGSTYPQRAWRKLDDWRRYAREHHKTEDDFFGGLLYLVGDAIEQSAYSMIRVSVSKDDNYATFQVDAERLPYFFKDRNIELTTAGHRKPIFHMVAAHVRKDGSTVPMHFRGEREFDWGPYHVLITVPGRDHTVIEEFDVPCIDSYWVKRMRRKFEKFVSHPEVGRDLRNIIRGGRM